MTVATLKRLWKNEYFKMAVMIISIVAIVFGFWYGLQLGLNTPYPALAVASGSMCLVEGMRCNGWDHPFERTLHKGDLIIVQGTDPKGLMVGDIIVFHKPMPTANDVDELIVHRVYEIENHSSNGMVYFETKGDASSTPDTFDKDYRGENYTWHNKISEKLVVGKVVFRIAWVGHVSLVMRNSSGMLIIIALIVVIVVVEFIVPAFTGKKAEPQPEEEAKETSETQGL